MQPRAAPPKQHVHIKTVKSGNIDAYPALKRSNDPLGLAVLIAFAAHAFVILAISFDINRDNRPAPERTLDITLVQPKAKPEKTVESPDFLAQQSQEGGGDKVIKERRSSPLGNPDATPSPKPALELERSGAVEPEPVPRPEVITTPRAERKVVTTPPRPEVAAKPRTRLSQLLASTQQEIDRLTAELDRRTLSASQQERRKSINASTQEYRYASYLEAWRRKVEKIGNLNYPDEARRRKLHGSLILHVAVRVDGSVERVSVRKSSGHKLLDDAAVRIVRLSAPFAPFPPEIRKDVDILDITRTWQFRDGGTLFSSR
jgi:protein TonB